ncbi:AMP-binding protein [Streptomyces californicus]
MATDTAPAWSFRHHWMAHTATHAMMRPDKPALRYLGATTTWAQLSRRSLQLAAALADRGVGEGDRVATLTLNHPWFVESVFAANSLGAMAVPLNFPAPARGDDRGGRRAAVYGNAPGGPHPAG